MSAMQERHDSACYDNLPTELLIPEGYQLGHYTLVRVRDGYLQSFVLVNGRATRVAPIPVPAQPPAIGLQQNSQGRHDELESEEDQDHSTSEKEQDHLTPLHSTNNGPYRKRQTHNIALQGDAEDLANSDREVRQVSESTRKRHAHARPDGYTSVCGVYSPAKLTPVKKVNLGNGEFCCPRCGSNFTRAGTVKYHFPACVMKYGNPQALRYTDHPSMATREVSIQRGARAGREVPNMDKERDDGNARAHSQGIEFEEMNEALYVDLEQVQICAVIDMK